MYIYIYIVIFLGVETKTHLFDSNPKIDTQMTRRSRAKKKSVLATDRDLCQAF